jgi:hypothetical protein
LTLSALSPTIQVLSSGAEKVWLRWLLWGILGLVGAYFSILILFLLYFALASYLPLAARKIRGWVSGRRRRPGAAE